jgi:hypothetical protein
VLPGQPTTLAEHLTYADDIMFLYWFKWRFCAV